MAKKIWSDKNSIILTKICIIILLAVCIVACIMGPMLTKVFMEGMEKAGRWMRAKDVNTEIFSYPVILTIGYLCGAAAITLLVLMLRFVNRIEKGKVFVLENVRDLRYMGWCCGVAALITLVVAIWVYTIFGFVSAAAFFMMLVIRIVKNAFSQACSMKDELDFTI